MAIAELNALPASLSDELAIARDWERGRALFSLRQDGYAEAAPLLLSLVDKLPKKDASRAAFLGARALSRLDRDAEAIDKYNALVERFPRSKRGRRGRFSFGLAAF